MNYLDLKQALKDYTVFSLDDIRQLNRKFFRPRLNEWQKKGYIKKVIKGFYIFSDLKISEPTLFEIANRLYDPAYVSLEMALSYYHLIPEGVYGVTSVSTKRTRRFKTPLAEFIYRKISPRSFWGYDLLASGGRSVKLASPEKAVLDFLYFNPHLKTKSDLAGLRLNRTMFLSQVKKDRYFLTLKRFGQKSLTRKGRLLWEMMNRA